MFPVRVTRSQTGASTLVRLDSIEIPAPELFLRMEVAPHGIRVVLIEPGDFRTGFTASRRMARNAGSSVYSARQAKALGVMEHDEAHGATPESVGRLVHRVITSRSPRARYVVGPVSETLALALRRFAPARLFEWGIAMYYRVR